MRKRVILFVLVFLIIIASVFTIGFFIGNKIHNNVDHTEHLREALVNSDKESFYHKGNDEQEEKLTENENKFYPEYSGIPAIVINDNIPYFTEEEKQCTISFEEYGELDDLGRCTASYICITNENMPTESRGNIGMVEPTGWHLVKYDFIEDLYLYNRCHVIGYQLTGQNANVRNLITGTRYMNKEGMLPYENEVAEYLKATDNHILYRVTPIFEGDNLLASGVVMEAYSIEDHGKGVCFCVYCFDVQPGVRIDYSTGDNEAEGKADGLDIKNKDIKKESEEDRKEIEIPEGTTYVLNTSSRRFHRMDC